MMQQTSLLAYKDALKASQVRYVQVLNALARLGGRGTDAEISEVSGLPINAVTPRRGELVKKGVVVKDGLVVNRYGRFVNAWRRLI